MRTDPAFGAEKSCRVAIDPQAVQVWTVDCAASLSTRNLGSFAVALAIFSVVVIHHVSYKTVSTYSSPAPRIGMEMPDELSKAF